jgi:hypothetical protein
MRFKAALLTVGLLIAASASGQTPPLLLGEDTVKVSDHVWANMGFPNIGIVIGGRGVAHWWSTQGSGRATAPP